MKRNGSAVWTGNLKEGSGVVSTPDSGVLSKVKYSFAQRFESERGTNPEELIAAAHAACFSMALSGELGKANLKPESVETRATMTFDKTDAGWTATEIHLDTHAKVPGADRAKFEQAAEAAKKGCPVSRLLAPGTKITLTARLN